MRGLLGAPSRETLQRPRGKRQHENLPRDTPRMRQQTGLFFFASKRPAYVLTVGSSGTHSVCVCMYHHTSENFAFVIQDCIKGYYWMNDHATLLPFMANMQKEDGSVSNVPICVISNILIHDIIAVHAFLSPVQTYFKNINSS